MDWISGDAPGPCNKLILNTGRVVNTTVTGPPGRVQRDHGSVRTALGSRSRRGLAFPLSQYERGYQPRTRWPACFSHQISPSAVLFRRPGRKQWRYSLACAELDCQLKARQAYEQQSGDASCSYGASFWEVRAGKS